MLADLFNETYAKFRKKIRDKIDNRYNYSGIINVEEINNSIDDRNIKMYQNFIST